MRYFFIFLFILSSYPVCSQSQSIDRIIQQEQQRLEEERRRIESEQRERTRRHMSEPQISEVVEDETCFDIHTIKFEGLSLFDGSDFENITADYINQCVGVSQLNQLLQLISREYFNAGYITSRAYLPQQNLQSGNLIVQIIEGKIEDVKRANEIELQAPLSIVFPAVKNKTLNLRDLEQGLEQINRLSSYKSTMELLPGNGVGETIVEINEQQGRPWQLSTRYDNSGQKTTGELQQQVFMSWDSPLRLYDYTYLSVQTDLKDDSDGKTSQSASWHWDMPLGYWSLAVDASYFKYLSTVQGTLQNFETSGNSATQSVNLSRVMHRDADSKTKLALGIKRKKTENFIEDALIEQSSRSLSMADITLSHEQYFSNGDLLVSAFTYERGLRWFESPNDDKIAGEFASATPKAQFDKFTTSFDYQHPFAIAGINAQYRTRVFGQYSDDVLYGTETISIGSAYSVRGYKEASLSSNQGGYWRNDILFSLRPEWAGNWLTSVTPFIGWDVGFIRDQERRSGKYAKLKGWAIGIMGGGQNWSTAMTFSQPIDAPKYLASTGDEFEFSLTAKF